MGAFSGPRINREGIHFYVDPRNQKSFLGNGVLKPINTNHTEVITNLFIDEKGFLFTSDKKTETLVDLQLSNKDEITVTILVNETKNNSGSVFSLTNGQIPIYRHAVDNKTTNSSGIVNTFSTQETPLLIPSDNQTSTTQYTSSPVSTIASTISLGTTIYASSQNTITSSSVVTTYATSELHDSTTTTNSSDNTVVISQTVNTTATNKTSLKTPFEINFYVNSKDMFVTHNNEDIDSTLFSESEDEKNIYTAVFRAINGTKSPLSLYKNGRFVAEYSLQTGLTELKNGQIKIFNTDYSYNSNYKIGLILIHDRELSDSEISLIRNLKGE
jgi:hypothetical protein